MGKIISYGIYLAIILGFLFPSEIEYELAIPFLLATILFFSFLKINFKWSNFFRKELCYYFFIGILLIPFVVFIFTKNLDPLLRLGLFMVSITPPAIGAPIIVDIVKGNRELVISNVVFYNLLSPLTYSLLLNIYFGKSEVVIPVKQIFLKLVLMLCIPLMLAVIVKNFVRLSEKLQNISRIVSPTSFILVVGVAVSSASNNLLTLKSIDLLKVAIFVLILAICSFFSGYILSKNDVTKKTLAIVFGHKNSTLTTWVILSNFTPPVVIPIIVYILFHNIINGIIIHKNIDS